MECRSAPLTNSRSGISPAKVSFPISKVFSMLNTNFSSIKLPSNRNFGLFFTAVFMLATAYSLIDNRIAIAILSFGLAALSLAVTVVKEELLLPLNKIWMRFGFFLGMIVSPIILGVIFFGLFTPLAFGMRLFGRDELQLKPEKGGTFWRLKKPVEQTSKTFQNQF